MLSKTSKNSSSDAAQASASRLWSIHLQYRASLPTSEADYLLDRMLLDPTWANSLLEIAQSCADAITSCVIDGDAEWCARVDGLVADPRLCDRELAAHGRFIVDSCAEPEFDRVGAAGERRSQARARRDALLGKFDERWPAPGCAPFRPPQAA